MENKAYIFELHDDHTRWLNDLAFCKDQIKVYEKRLAEVSLKNLEKEEKVDVEKFQNRFLIQRNEIDYLKHDIKQQENVLEKVEKAAPILSEEGTITEELSLKDRMQIFEKLFNELKGEFDLFIEQHI